MLCYQRHKPSNLDLKGGILSGGMAPSLISPSGRFKQPLSSPSSLYADLPNAPGIAASSVSPSSGLGTSSLFGKTISSGEALSSSVYYICFYWYVCRFYVIR